MKTLKFRFYDKTKKSMRYFDSIWNMPDPDYDFDEIQQFTGLLDRNGKEIYEGDIIEPEEKGIRDSIYYQVFYCAPEFLIKDNYGIINTFFRSWHWEVIGNIYENPELLK